MINTNSLGDLLKGIKLYLKESDSLKKSFFNLLNVGDKIIMNNGHRFIITKKESGKIMVSQTINRIGNKVGRRKYFHKEDIVDVVSINEIEL